MLITKEWSKPRSVEFGKSILVRSSHPNFYFKIYSAKGQSVEGLITERVFTINADDELIRLVRLPMISFRAINNQELHVEFSHI